MLTKLCLICEKSFNVWPCNWKKAKFCSIRCKAIYCRKHGWTRKTYKLGKDCPWWKGGFMINKYGYKLIYSPNHPNTPKNFYIMEHRLVMEKHLGRYLKLEEIIHHVNGNKLDNRIENLKLYKNTYEHIKTEHPSNFSSL